MKQLNRAIAVAVTAAMLFVIASSIGAVRSSGADEIGWQYDTFAENLWANVTPEEVTIEDKIVVTLTSKIDLVWIKQANVYGVVYPKDGVQFPFTYPFQKKTDTRFECAIQPFPLNGYRIEFYIFAYDYLYSPMDSRNSMSFEYDVVGSGWKNDTFEENIELTYWPLRANATEEVWITLRSRENVSISGANLYMTYVTAEGVTREGGWNFTRANVNSTEMRQRIPGYPAGTNVTFWVTAWDQYNVVMTSGMYNYSIMGLEEYTDYPFVYTGGTDDKSRWVPDDAIILPMAGMTALAIPLFIYLLAINLKRRKRAVQLVKTKQGEETHEEYPEVPEAEPDE